MQLFIIVLFRSGYMQPIFKKLADNGFHGSVISTQSIKEAFMNSIEPEPYFGGLMRLVDEPHEPRPMLLTVIKDDEVSQITKLVNEVTKGIVDKGCMFTVPVNFIEGLKE